MLFCTLSLFNLQQIPRACHVKGINIWKSIQHKDSNWLKWLINISSICGQKRCHHKKCHGFADAARRQLVFTFGFVNITIASMIKLITWNLVYTSCNSMEKGWPEGCEDFDLRIQSGSDLETVQWGRTMLFSIAQLHCPLLKKCFVPSRNINIEQKNGATWYCLILLFGVQ